ncbi:MAG: SLBB domain-containing protein, partial [Mariprofundaceae bacterium]|nr:SLBB domain-containing protein [Mariprofundaceae bacterium]
MILNKWLLLFVFGLVFAGWGPLPVERAMGVQISPEQMLQLEKLSTSRKSNLSHPTVTKIVASPEVIKPRGTGSGPVERGVAGESKDAALQARELKPAPEVVAPVRKVDSQAGADRLEVRRAFEDFVAGSKTLQVNTGDLKQFGYDLFAGAPTTFAPATDVPVPPEYVLGPGDELKVQLFGQKNDVFSLTVDRDGSVAFPEVGSVNLAGMSFTDAKALLAQQLREKMIGVTASISMGQLRSIRVFALGEVSRPGSYVVSGLATLSHALMVSGGIKKTGSLRLIQLKRQGRVVASIDLYRFLLYGDTKNDARLLPGDVVFVPPIGKTAAIAGQVLRPAIYEYRGKANIGDLLILAGGALPRAYMDKALLERINSNGEKTVKNFRMDGTGLVQRLQNGDVIKVFSALDFEDNPVLLIGNVKRPGKYAWSKGMGLSSLLPSTDALLPESFMDYGMIEREAKGNREPEIVRFRLSDVFLPKGERVDVALHPRDKVYVFHRSHFRVAPRATVAGSVKSPGEYEVKKNMRLLDLVLAAGGLTRDSLMDRAELYRTDAKSKDVSVIRFPLSAVMQGEAKYNLLLQDMDRVVVHSIWEVKKRHQVRVVGEVRKPGEYAMAEGLHVADLVFAAGNVTEKAYLKQAEITRYEVVEGG